MKQRLIQYNDYLIAISPIISLFVVLHMISYRMSNMIPVNSYDVLFIIFIFAALMLFPFAIRSLIKTF